MALFGIAANSDVSADAQAKHINRVCCCETAYDAVYYPKARDDQGAGATSKLAACEADAWSMASGGFWALAPLVASLKVAARSLANKESIFAQAAG
jgi:1-deoxy-D-xylulose 5-phosphate reductoisomerase